MEKRKQGKCTCGNCGVTFEKPQSEISRNHVLGRKNFCTRRCSGLNNVKNFGKRKGNNRPLGYKYPETKYTKFKYHYRTLVNRNREKGKELSVTIDDLIEQWNLQNGICEFTGIKLILSSYTKIEKSNIYSASLDRIDSNIGYTKENIRWVSRAINFMKNSMSDDETWEVCKLISDNYIKKGLK